MPHPVPLDDDRFMAAALAEARRAERAGEVPVGALVISPSGELLSRGHNLMIARHDPTAHAEVVALRRAGRRVRNDRLTGCTLYVTLEPCLLCVGALVHARIARVVYGADDPKRGAIAAARAAAVAPLLHHSFRVTAGVRAAEAGALLRDFFRARRLSGRGGTPLLD
jgi:tRNA(adenine34) deaminase